MPHKDMYTQAEAMDYLGISRQGLYLARKNKALHGVIKLGKRVLLYSKDGLDDYKKIMRRKYVGSFSLPPAPPILSPNESANESEE